MENKDFLHSHKLARLQIGLTSLSYLESKGKYLVYRKFIGGKKTLKEFDEYDNAFAFFNKLTAQPEKG